MIRQRDPPNLGICVSCDRDLIARFDIPIVTQEDGPIRTEHRLVVVSVAAERLPAGRPCAATLEVADVEVLSPAVAGRVLAPARHVEPLAGAVPAPGLGQHDRITTVRQQADGGRRHVGCSPVARAAVRGSYRRTSHGDPPCFLAPSTDDVVPAHANERVVRVGAILIRFERCGEQSILGRVGGRSMEFLGRALWAAHAMKHSEASYHAAYGAVSL